MAKMTQRQALMKAMEKRYGIKPKRTKRNYGPRLPVLRGYRSKEKPSPKSATTKHNGGVHSSYNYNGQNVSAGQYSRMMQDARSRIARNKQIRADYDAAKQANETRYQDILGGYNDIERQMQTRNPAGDYSAAAQMAASQYDQGMGYLENAGVQEGSDIRQRGFNTLQKFKSDAISRGVNVPGLMTSTERGINRDTSNSLGRLGDRLNAQRLNTVGSLGRQKINVAMAQANASNRSYSELMNARRQRLGFMERRTDAYPNTNVIAGYSAR